MADIFFDEAFEDIVLRDGDLMFTTDDSPTETIRQRALAYLKTFLGEWFLDSPENPVVGVPYFQSLLADKIPTLQLADSIFRTAILKIEGIDSVETLEFDFDRISRVMQVRFVCISSDGLEFPIELEEII